MANWEETIIPLGDAHKILSSFGIGPDSNGYQRWRQDDGFRQVDFEGVLNESKLVLSVDWRDLLQDATDTIIEQLGSLGITTTADLGEDGEQGFIEVDGKRADIKYVPNDNDDFESAIRTVNVLISGKASYRKYQSCVGSDGWRFGLHSTEEWEFLKSNAPGSLDLIFVHD
jgi:hypothetical protein